MSLQARLVFSDLSGKDVTVDTVWTSSAPEVATVDPAPGQPGRFRAVAPGVARIFASAGGKAASTTLTVLLPRS